MGENRAYLALKPRDTFNVTRARWATPAASSPSLPLHH